MGRKRILLSVQDMDESFKKMVEVLNEYADHRDIEKLKELIDEYLDIQRDKEKSGLEFSLIYQNQRNH